MNARNAPGRLARSLGYLDWDNQPDSFRRFDGAPTFATAREPVGPHPRYGPAFRCGQIEPSAVGVETISRLFYDALALYRSGSVPRGRSHRYPGDRHWVLLRRRDAPIFGMKHDSFQVLYHFTMGGAVDDPRLKTQPPYGHLDRQP